MSFFFIHLSDPQFGLFESHGLAPGDGTYPETPLYEKAIAAANRLKPAFVVITGDLVQHSDDPKQHAELMRITGQLREDVPIYFTTGNCDVGNTPTKETLRVYREKFGYENYSFDAEGSHFVALNSSVCLDPSEVPDEWDSLLDFLRADLESHASDATHTVVFMHHPLFSESPDQPDDGNKIIPRSQRMPVLEILREHGVSGVFAGSLAQQQLLQRRRHAHDHIRPRRVSAGRRPVRAAHRQGLRRPDRAPVLRDGGHP